jgi:hypothetical protein
MVQFFSWFVTWEFCFLCIKIMPSGRLWKGVGFQSAILCMSELDLLLCFNMGFSCNVQANTRFAKESLHLSRMCNFYVEGALLFYNTRILHGKGVWPGISYVSMSPHCTRPNKFCSPPLLFPECTGWKQRQLSEIRTILSIAVFLSLLSQYWCLLLQMLSICHAPAALALCANALLTCSQVTLVCLSLDHIVVITSKANLLDWPQFTLENSDIWSSADCSEQNMANYWQQSVPFSWWSISNWMLGWDGKW